PPVPGAAQLGQAPLAPYATRSRAPTSFAYQWLRCDEGGANCSPIELASESSYTLAAADVGATLRVQVIASNAAGPSTPARSSQAAVVAQAPQPPASTSPPTITGSAQVGQALSADAGEWSGAPTSFAYQWLRCDEGGANCSPIELASESSYTLAAADVGATLRVQVIASNAAGPSTPARSSQTAVVAATTGVQHLEYVFNDGLISVYDMDHEQKLVTTISLPQTDAGIRGATVSPVTHMLFISYGGDGGGNGNGSVL